MPPLFLVRYDGSNDGRIARVRKIDHFDGHFLDRSVYFTDFVGTLYLPVGSDFGNDRNFLSDLVAGNNGSGIFNHSNSFKEDFK